MYEETYKYEIHNSPSSLGAISIIQEEIMNTHNINLKTPLQSALRFLFLLLCLFSNITLADILPVSRLSALHASNTLCIDPVIVTSCTVETVNFDLTASDFTPFIATDNLEWVNVEQDSSFTENTVTVSLSADVFPPQDKITGLESSEGSTQFELILDIDTASTFTLTGLMTVWYPDLFQVYSTLYLERSDGTETIFTSSLLGPSGASENVSISGFLAPGRYRLFASSIASAFLSAQTSVNFTFNVIPSTSGLPPVADAGLNQTIHVGTLVNLNGNGSFDDVTPTQDLGFNWELQSAPAGSNATLLNNNTATPDITPDLPGDYIVSLVVIDAGGLSSAPDTVIISSSNTPPNADAGPGTSVIVGNLITLNGSNSSDPDNDQLTFTWSLLTKPVNSTTVLFDVTSTTPSLTPDFPGSYQAQLVVNDGLENSLPSTVTVVAVTVNDFVAEKVMKIINAVNVLPIQSFVKKGNQRDMVRKLQKSITSLQSGKIDIAINQLNDVITRTDGCALRGSPDLFRGLFDADYINNCADQSLVYPLLNDVLSLL